MFRVHSVEIISVMLENNLSSETQMLAYALKSQLCDTESDAVICFKVSVTQMLLYALNEPHQDKTSFFCM